MAKRKSSYQKEQLDDWSDYKKADAKKDHKHRDERKQKADKRQSDTWEDN